MQMFLVTEKGIFVKIYTNSNQHITMISEWSCDTEDWSNNAENSAFSEAIVASSGAFLKIQDHMDKI